MAVPDQIPLVIYTANGETNTFPITFDLHDDRYLDVLINKELAPVGSYIVENLQAGRKQVNFRINPRKGDEITLARSTSKDRETNFNSYDGSFNPKTMNWDLDKIWHTLQEQYITDAQMLARLKNEMEMRRTSDSLLQSQLDLLKGVLLGVFENASNSYLKQKLKAVEDVINYMMSEGASGAGWVAGLIVDESGLNQQQINNKSIKTYETVNTLPSQGRDGEVAYVLDKQKRYIYQSDSGVIDNGVTVVGNWEMETQERYYASWFAEPNQGDVSEEIKIGYAYATSKKRQFIVDANFNLRSRHLINGTTLLTAFSVLSNSELIFLPEGKFSLISDDESNSNIICVKDADNYVIISPELVGDRLTNTAKEGSREWGYGLTIYPSSNGYIFEPDISNCMGDGLYIGKNWANNTDQVPKNITVVRPKIDRVRRNGLSFTSGDNVKVVDPIISNVTNIDGIDATEPKSGLDIEPESADDYAKARMVNCVVTNPTFINCDKAINFWNQAVDSYCDFRIEGTVNIHNPIKSTQTGFWGRNEINNAPKSSIMIDKIIFHDHIDAPFAVFIYEDMNMTIKINEVVNNSGGSLDFTYLPVGENKTFGKFTIGRLGTSDARYGFTIVHSNYNVGCNTGLKVESVECPIAQWNVTKANYMGKTKDYHLRYDQFVLGNDNTDNLMSNRLIFESYNVTAPSLTIGSSDLSRKYVSLSPTSPSDNPLTLSGLTLLANNQTYSKIVLQRGASFEFQKGPSGVLTVFNSTGNYEFQV